MARLPEHILKALKETGLPWEIEPKRKHRFLKICGQIVIALPLEGSKGGRNIQNNIARIKRFARELEVS